MDLDSRIVFIHSSVEMFFHSLIQSSVSFHAPEPQHERDGVASVWVLVLMCTPSWGEINLAGFISQSGSVFILPEEGQVHVPSGQMQCVIAAQHPAGLNKKMCLMRTTCEKHPLINWKER